MAQIDKPETRLWRNCVFLAEIECIVMNIMKLMILKLIAEYTSINKIAA